MKKLFTSMLMMFGCMAAMSAQSVTLQKGAEGEVTYKSGDVIEVKAEKMGDETFSYYKWDPELYLLLSNTSTTVTTTLSSESSSVQFCGGDGNCQMTGPGKPVEKKIALTSGKPEALLIDIMDMAGVISDTEEITATLTVATLTKTESYTIKFLPKNNAGMLDAETEANAISVSGRSLTYSFTHPTVLTLYTISGQAAVTRTLNGAGSMSLEALPGGVYIYRAGTQTGKFIVR
ncbi:MAG: T9SS type A sorting domain-containing protein [Muribaculaceae bacterium]|nr:T9SS type A sorting domain-containing protein [Muribaculaceae bacterium]MDE6315535.1 T9SS type A sorting domain-containing protein [Muribaculaceae bacterium]